MTKVKTKPTDEPAAGLEAEDIFEFNTSVHPGRIVIVQEGSAEVDAEGTKHTFWVRAELPLTQVPGTKAATADMLADFRKKAGQLSDAVLLIKEAHIRKQQYQHPEGEQAVANDGMVVNPDFVEQEY